MPLCTHCAESVAYLYTLYHSVNNVRLEQCVRVHFLSTLTHPPTVLGYTVAALMSRTCGSLRRARPTRHCARPHSPEARGLQALAL